MPAGTAASRWRQWPWASRWDVTCARKTWPFCRRRCVRRWPDDDGFFLGPDAGLAFRRLAIVDLAGGRQPMANEDGQVHLVFNGEIYDHHLLRDQLQKRGHRFATDHSDTEVLVHGWEEW